MNYKDQVLVLLSEWIRYKEEAILEQILVLLQEEAINHFVVLFQPWDNSSAEFQVAESVQEFLINANAILHNFDWLRECINLKGYFYRMRVNTFNKRYRKLRQADYQNNALHTQVNLLDHCPHETVDEAETELKRKLWKSYQAFMQERPQHPKKQLSYQVFQLRIEGDMTYEDIAETLNHRLNLLGSQEMLTPERVGDRCRLIERKFKAYCRSKHNTGTSAPSN